MRLLTSSVLLVVVALAGIFATGCPERRTIAEIERNPGRYQDKEVVIAGVVRDSYGVSIPGTNIGGGAYKIDDGTGSIWVVVTDGSVPSKGAEVGIKGVVGNGINWKGRNYGLGLWEKDRKYRKR
jgi:hypothetical protein